MEKIMKSVCVMLVVLLMVAFMCVPSFAASDDIVNWTSTVVYTSPTYQSVDLEAVSSGNYSGYLYFVVCEGLLPGNYRVDGVALSDGMWSGSAPLVLAVALYETATGNSDVAFIEFGTAFIVPDGYVGHVVAQSHGDAPILYRVTDDDVGGVYWEIKDLFIQYIFGADVELSVAQNAQVSIIALVAVLVLIALPFSLLLLIIKLVGRWR